MSNQSRRAAIDIAIAAGTEPTIGRSAQTTLRLRQNPGRSSYTLLSRADGTRTPAGEYYYETTGRPAPSRMFDHGAPLIQRGASDYVTTRNGKLALVRTLMPDGTTRVTRLGKQYFRAGKTEYIVSIPVQVSGTNRRGRVQQRATMLPVTMLGIGQILQDNREPEVRRIAKVKSHILKQLAIRTSGGASVVLEVSGEVFTYDRDSEWLISSQTTSVGEDGAAVTETAMRQHLGAGPRSCAAFLAHGDFIVYCAFESHADMLCVPRQLAAVLGVSMDEALS